MRSDLIKTHCALCMKLEMCLRTEPMWPAAVRRCGAAPQPGRRCHGHHRLPRAAQDLMLHGRSRRKRSGASVSQRRPTACHCWAGCAIRVGARIPPTARLHPQKCRAAQTSSQSAARKKSGPLRASCVSGLWLASRCSRRNCWSRRTGTRPS